MPIGRKYAAGDILPYHAHVSPRTGEPCDSASSISTCDDPGWLVADEQTFAWVFFGLPLFIVVLITIYLLVTSIIDHRRRAHCYQQRAEFQRYQQYLLHRDYECYDRISSDGGRCGSYGTLATISEDEENGEFRRQPSSSYHYGRNRSRAYSTRCSSLSLDTTSTYVDSPPEYFVRFQIPFSPLDDIDSYGNDFAPVPAANPQHNNKGRPRQPTPAVSPQTYPLRDRIKDDEAKRHQAIAFVQRATNSMSGREVRRRSSSVGERELRSMNNAFQAAGSGKQDALPAIPQLLRTSTRSCEDLLHGGGRVMRFRRESDATEAGMDKPHHLVENIEFLRI